MENGLTVSNPQQVAILEHREACQNFLVNLNRKPAPESMDKTPDGKANTILISHIETALDEFFFGLWETENFKWSVIANEVVGSLDLVFTHPVTLQKMRRVGAACIQIMVHKAPENMTPQEKTLWANNPDNKKSNALDMGFPKLKAECLKNAALSIGDYFGRNINRGGKADTYTPRGIQKAATATAAAKQALNGKEQH